MQGVLTAAPILITVLVAVLGFRAWYWQLVAKRRFEVAEHALTVFGRASEALHRIRQGFVDGHEVRSAMAEAEKVPEPNRDPNPQWHVFSIRVDKLSEAFDAIRPAQLLCELHVSKRASDSLGVLLSQRNRVLTAAKFLATGLIPAKEPEEREKIRDQCKDVLWEMRDHTGKPTERDKVSALIDEARDALEVDCKPLLREQTFWEFVRGRT
jgi:hypothetical protein